MGPDTEERLKAINADVAEQAAQEAARLIYEKLLPILVQKQQRDDSLLKVIIDTMKHFISQVELRLLKR